MKPCTVICQYCPHYKPSWNFAQPQEPCFLRRHELQWRDLDIIRVCNVCTLTDAQEPQEASIEHKAFKLPRECPFIKEHKHMILGQKFTESKFRDLLDKCVKEGFISLSIIKSSTKPKTVYTTNPAVLKGKPEVESGGQVESGV